MDLGTVSDCGGYGPVSSENGDYVGGVCGLSLSSIRHSYAKCTLTGRKYVGGIVGSGSRVSDCLSMVAIADYTQLGGAVAGEITGDYSGNCFVSDTLAGVDRISYAGKAEQITYDALCQREDTPQQFRSLILRFLSDGKTVKSQTFTYGASFSSDIYPDLPEREDSYVHWDNQNLTGLRFDTDVTAVYEPYVTTLASTQQRDGQPVLLVQGKFREGDALRVSQGSASLTENVVESWAVTIPKDGQETHNVRWRITDKGKRYTVYRETDSGARKLDSAVDGRLHRGRQRHRYRGIRPADDMVDLGGRRRNAPAGRGRGDTPAPPRRAEETDARRRISTPQKVEKQRQTGAAFLYDGCVSAVIVACGGVDHDEGDDLAVHLHIDLIDTALQLLIVIRRDVVVVQQALFKFRLPGVLIGVRIPGGIFRRCVRVSGGVCLLTGRVPLRRGGRGRYTAAAGKREHQQCRQQGGDDSVFHSHTPFIFVRRTSPVRPSDFPV